MGGYYGLIQTILSMECGWFAKNNIYIDFEACNGTNRDLPFALIRESWDAFVKFHSLWELGPGGYYIAPTERACIGCEDTKQCHFRRELFYNTIGCWLGYLVKNQHLTGVLRYPLDVFFLQVIAQGAPFFPEQGLDTTEKIYLQIVEKREYMLQAISKGFSTIPLADTFLSPLDLACKLYLTPLDRPKFGERINIIQGVGVYEEDYVRMLQWIRIWIYRCSERHFRAFLMEILGSTVYADITITIVKGNGTLANVCERTLEVPLVQDRDLLEQILSFDSFVCFNQRGLLY